MSQQHFDVLIVGAGLSGIGAGYHLQRDCPDRTYAILEARDAIGGTWDLFRYPGIRSDSDMYTLGYSFRPWTNAKAIADGPSILELRAGYRAGVRHRSPDPLPAPGRRAQHGPAEAAQWTVEAERENGETVRFTCNFLFMCSGYYNYSEGYTPEFPGRRALRRPHRASAEMDRGHRLRGQARRRHRQRRDRRDARARDGEDRPRTSRCCSARPTYVVSLPAQDSIANFLRKILPAKLAYGIVRWKNVLLGMFFFRLCRRSPEFAKKLILRGVRRRARSRLRRRARTSRLATTRGISACASCRTAICSRRSRPEARRSSPITSRRFTEKGIKLRSGKELDADLIVTATGLNLLVLGGMQIAVDGRAVDLAKTLSYKGMMYSDVPNLASAFGYTNASWTLKCDLTCEYVCRLLNHMEAHGLQQCTPRRNDPSITEMPWIDFTSGYVQRSLDKFPKQGSKAPWRLYQNYALDIMTLRFGSVDDEAMEFSNPAQPNVQELPRVAGL